MLYKRTRPLCLPLCRVLGLLGAWAAQTNGATPAPLTPTCTSNIYCSGDLLRRVQLARIYSDSKKFVDLKMLKPENETLTAFEALLQRTGRDPTRADLETFVDSHFQDGDELEQWTPPDFLEEPPLLAKVKDPKLREFAKNLVGIWPSLGRKVIPDVFKNPDRYSLVPLPNGFVVPGGRFKEIYYWDSFWIVRGLLLSGMTETARGMIENLLHLIKVFGHVPNGSRIYYAARSQPPLLTAMVAEYVLATGDLAWLKANIDIIETELQYWLDHKTVLIKKRNTEFVLLRYYSQTNAPRPESYAEDFQCASLMSDERRNQFYGDIQSAAESGWDFSSRWFVAPDGSNSGNLTNSRTTRIVPVDLNAIYAAALRQLGDFYAQLKQRRSAKRWWNLAKYWRWGIEETLWNNEDGIWYDLDATTGLHRRYFYPSSLAPLWMRAVDKRKIGEYATRVMSYMHGTDAMSYPGGIPTSMHHTGEQWDFPNAWPPLQSIVINGLAQGGTLESKRMAFELAQVWVRANYKGFNQSHAMYEKYNVEHPGQNGGGGEYVVQSGFGWTNGVVLELLDRYGHDLTLHDTRDICVDTVKKCS